MDKIRIAIAGIGNCASALVQGMSFYRGQENGPSWGLMHYDLGGYKPDDIEVVAAFDIDRRKVGRDLSEAIFAPPNCTTLFQTEIYNPPVEVKMGPIMDGVAAHMIDYPDTGRSFLPAEIPPVDVVRELKKSRAQMLLNFLPVGSVRATHFYTQAALEARVGFINCIPVFVASSEIWADRFRARGLPIIGDDIKSQLGATILHRVVGKLFQDRGMKIDHTYQLNFGGNTDFLNMLDRGRLTQKKQSKTRAVQAQLSDMIKDEDIHIGPSDYVPWLQDNKHCIIRIEGRGFGEVPMKVEIKLSVEDSPNSAGVSIDAIRCLRLALDQRISGPLTWASAYFMKHPKEQYPEELARGELEKFISTAVEVSVCA